MLKDILATIKVGDKIKWKDQKRPFTIKARDGRYLIATRLLFGEVQYTIIDTQDMICGPNDFVFNPYDYKSQKDIDESLIDLQNGKYEISYRRRANADECLYANANNQS